METLPLIGYASGIAANNTGCGDGPLQLQQSELLLSSTQWLEILSPNYAQPSKLAMVTTLCQKLAATTQQLTLAKQLFTVIGGDHSCAIGTWSGVQNAITPHPLGLIWIDAHIDSHTFETTPSGNIHGMPLACLLGYGTKKLTQILAPQPKILPENLCLIGVRSYEPEEYELLKQLKVKIFFMEDVQRLGLFAVMEQALHIVTANTAGYGISLDLDAIDPSDAPGVGCPEKNGLKAKDLCVALKLTTHFANLLGTEIVEFNPYRDYQQRTEQLIIELLALFANGQRN